jgi:hypothetical protein
VIAREEKVAWAIFQGQTEVIRSDPASGRLTCYVQDKCIHDKHVICIAPASFQMHVICIAPASFQMHVICIAPASFQMHVICIAPASFQNEKKQDVHDMQCTALLLLLFVLTCYVHAMYMLVICIDPA